MEKCQDKFMSPDIQNEILFIMSHFIQREIADAVSGQWFTIMVDETTDQSNLEQMVFCLRYVDCNLNVHACMRSLLVCIALSQHRLTQ